MSEVKNSFMIIDGSKLIIESLVRSGVEAYVSYPITPANWLNEYATQRFPYSTFAPDEITVLQWASGLSAAGIITATSTSFPGFALMLETVNMAFMMELPLIIVLAQRMGPSTGSATVGAQGDLMLLNGCISGGYNIPVFSISNLIDCWNITSKAVEAAVKLRTPVVLLTSKEMIMTTRSLDTSALPKLEAAELELYKGNGRYLSYEAGENLAPPFLPVTNNQFQVRINSSTHDAAGTIRKASKDALANTLRLHKKIQNRISEFLFYEMDEQPDNKKEILIVTYDITSEAVRDAAAELRSSGVSVSALYVKTILPVHKKIIEIIERYRFVLFAEENATGLLAKIIYGERLNERVKRINKIGLMITPQEIIKEAKECQQISC